MKPISAVAANDTEFIALGSNLLGGSEQSSTRGSSKAAPLQDNGGITDIGHRENIVIACATSSSTLMSAGASARTMSPQPPIESLVCCKPVDWSPSLLSPSSGCPSDPVMESFRLAGLAAMFELGCVFHSFIIGLMLGTTREYHSAVALLLALVFHQFLEGIGLGTVLMAAQLTRLRLLFMTTVYAVTCPFGIAVGIAIADTYDSHSITPRAVQGTLNGVSAGLLLYLVSAVIACDFGRGAMARWRVWERLLLFGVMCTGAGLFAMLSMWA